MPVVRKLLFRHLARSSWKDKLIEASQGHAVVSHHFHDSSPIIRIQPFPGSQYAFDLLPEDAEFLASSINELLEHISS